MKHVKYFFVFWLLIAPLAAFAQVQSSANLQLSVTVTAPASGDAGVIINNAITSLVAGCGSATYCGTVYLTSGNFTLNTSIVPKSGVSIIGVPSQFQSLTSNAFEGGTGDYPIGGTILVAGSATTAIAYDTASIAVATVYAGGTTYSQGQTVSFNSAWWYSLQNGNLGNTPTTSPTFWREWGTSASGTCSFSSCGPLNNVKIKDIAFTGFTSSGIQIGGVNNEGCQYCELDNLIFWQDAWSVILKNWSESQVTRIWVSVPTAGCWQITSSFPAAFDQMGNTLLNSLHCDMTTVSPNSNFIQGGIFGSDSSNPADSQMNDEHAHFIDIEAFVGRNTAITDTGAFSGAGTTITIGTTGANFPVGMPIQFSALNSGTRTNVIFNRTYFVLTNDGANHITVGNCRSCAAFANNNTANFNIAQEGYPLLDLGGIVASPSVPLADSTFEELDLEGPSFGVAYLENGNNVKLGFTDLTLTTAFNPHAVSYVGRLSTQVIVDSISPFLSVDVDGSSGINTMLRGFQNTPVSGSTASLPGLFQFPFAGAAAANCLSLSGQYNGPVPDLCGSAANVFLSAYVPVGQNVATITGTQSINTWNGGYVDIYGGSASTITLPTLSNTNEDTATAGLPFELFNVGAGTATITTAGLSTAGQKFNNASLTTGLTLPTGAAALGRAAMSAGSRGGNNGTTYYGITSLSGGASLGSLPTISSGFGTSPSVVSAQANGNGWSIAVNVGTGGVATSGVVSIANQANGIVAPHGWACSVADVTTPAGNASQQTGSAATTVTVTNYVRTTGVAGAWPASDILALNCAPN